MNYAAALNFLTSQVFVHVEIGMFRTRLMVMSPRSASPRSRWGLLRFSSRPAPSRFPLPSRGAEAHRILRSPTCRKER